MKTILLVLLLIAGFTMLSLAYMTGMPGPAVRTAGNATASEETLEESIQGHVEYLVNDLGQRNASSGSNDQEAGRYLSQLLRKTDLELEEHVFQARGKSRINYVAKRKGTKLASEVVVIGAHYDAPRDTPGANDNASGCAVLVELAKTMARGGDERSIRFVFFANGAEPFAGTPDSGASAYAKACREKGETIVAMLAVDSVGCYSDKPDSQKSPGPLAWMMPKQGNFVCFAGNFSARDLVATCVEQARSASRLECEGLLMPEFLPGLAISDDTGFREHGFPALMVTDTGAWRSAATSTRKDTVETLDYARMARLVTVLQKVVSGLAKRTVLHS